MAYRSCVMTSTQDRLDLFDTPVLSRSRRNWSISGITDHYVIKQLPMLIFVGNIGWFRDSQCRTSACYNFGVRT